MINQPEMRPDPTTAAGWRVRACISLSHLSSKDRKHVLAEFAEDAPEMEKASECFQCGRFVIETV